jgi:hypothetical protein
LRFLLSLALTSVFLSPQNPIQPNPNALPAPLPPPTVRIDEYRSPATRIINAALTSDKAYQRLVYLTDHIGNRLSGSQGLERAIDWATAEMKRDGLDNVRAEKVMVPHWVRGEESPRDHETGNAKTLNAWTGQQCRNTSGRNYN